jgi:hypothetical protein
MDDGRNETLTDLPRMWVGLGVGLIGLTMYIAFWIWVI